MPNLIEQSKLLQTRPDSKRVVSNDTRLKPHVPNSIRTILSVAQSISNNELHCCTGYDPECSVIPRSTGEIAGVCDTQTLCEIPHKSS